MAVAVYSGCDLWNEDEDKVIRPTENMGIARCIAAKLETRNQMHRHEGNAIPT